MIAPEILIAYVDGELSGADLAAVETAIAVDPELAAQVVAHRALHARLSRAYAPIAEEAPPQRLIDAAHATAPRTNVITLPAARRAPAFVAAISALAASFVVGLVIGGHASNSGISSTDDGLIARGELARALDVQLASETEANAPIQIGLSFRAKDGGYCRTFQLRRDEGLACRDAQQWRIELATRAPARTEFQMAGSSAVLDAVQSRVAGEALDSDQERAARDAGWRD